MLDAQFGWYFGVSCVGLLAVGLLCQESVDYGKEKESLNSLAGLKVLCELTSKF